MCIHLYLLIIIHLKRPPVCVYVSLGVFFFFFVCVCVCVCVCQIEVLCCNSFVLKGSKSCRQKLFIQPHKIGRFNINIFASSTNRNGIAFKLPLYNCYFLLSKCYSFSLFVYLYINFWGKGFEAGNLRDTFVGIEILPKRKLNIEKSC